MKTTTAITGTEPAADLIEEVEIKMADHYYATDEAVGFA
jgi:hypothetical protein